MEFCGSFLMDTVGLESDMHTYTVVLSRVLRIEQTSG